MALLMGKGQAWDWSPMGSRMAPQVDQGQAVEVLTPRAVVGEIRADSIYLVLAFPALPNLMMENPPGPKNP